MAKTKKAAAAATLTITADCERHDDGFGALGTLGVDYKAEHDRATVSALKTKLFQAGYESREESFREQLKTMPDGEAKAELVKPWDEWAAVCGWNPLPERESWILAALLFVEDADGADAVALFARPAGLVDAAPGGAPKTLADAEAKPWPFPKTEGGGPDASSIPSVSEHSSEQSAADSQPAPATMTRQEASARKPGRFELLEPTDALLKTFTPRVEKHGEDDVSAASLGLQIEAPNTILDLLSSSLRPTLYAAADNGAKVDGKPASQRTIEGVEESTPLLRTKVIETLKLNNCYEGWTLRISWGFEEAMTISECKVDKFVVTPKDGGSVILDLRVGSSDIGEDEAGWLYGKLRHNIEITLHAPEVKAEPIDGTQAAFERDHPPADDRDAGDLFAEQHGRNADGSLQEPDSDPDGSGEREAEEQAS